MPNIRNTLPPVDPVAATFERYGEALENSLHATVEGDWAALGFWRAEKEELAAAISPAQWRPVWLWRGVETVKVFEEVYPNEDCSPYVLTLSLHDPISHHGFGRCLQLDHEDFKGAEAPLRTAVRIAPQFAQAWMQLGFSLTEARR